MTIDLYRLFAKKENSTKQPDSGVIKITLNGRLRDGCSVVHPIIDIEPMSSVFAPSIYTYAHISGFNKYYFVQDWRWNNGLWTAVMNEDILATYKTAIGAQTCYVLRHDSVSDFNEDISDIAYPATANVSNDTYYLQNAFIDDITQGCYILGVISNETTESVGAITYYVMTHQQIGILKNKLLTNENLSIMGIIDSGGQSLITDVAPELLKTLYNPYQYIASCMWFPFQVSALENISTGVDTIPVGWWSYPCTARRIYANVYKIAFAEIGPVYYHPQIDRGWYLNYAPYTRRMIRGRFGQVVLDPSWFHEEDDRLGITYNVDIITGQCLAEIGTRRQEGSTYTVNNFTERTFLLGVPIQLAQIGVDYIGTGISAVNTIGAGLEGAMNGLISTGTTSGAVKGAITAAASGVYNTLQSAMPLMETSGDNGSFIAAGHLTEVITQWYLIADEDIHHKGRPLCELRQLDTLSGFILCADGEIDLDCFDEEKTAIARYLTNGFFWE